MTTPKDGQDPTRHFAEAEQAALYETLGGFLQQLLTRAFELPEQVAAALVRETFYQALHAPAPDARAWLIAAACRSANDYRQNRGLPAANEEEIARHAATVLSYREAMESLPTRAREALRLRFEQKKTYPEIAEELGVSKHAAERIVAKAVARLREVLRGRGPRSI